MISEDTNAQPTKAAQEPNLDEVDWGPTQRPLDDGEPCPECGPEFDADKWDVRHFHGGAWIGESWVFTCSGCEQETCIIST